MKKDRLFVASGLVLAFLFLLQGCNNSDEGTDLINYSELDEISTGLLLEIGHRESDPIFGTLNGLVILDDGSMVVGDRGTRRIDQFSGDGTYMGNVATEGEGPGELSIYFDLVPGTNGGLVVQHIGMDNRIDFFIPGVDKSVLQIERSLVEESAIQRLFQLLGPLSGNRYLARATDLDRNLSPEQWAAMEYRESVITVVDQQSELVRDSISTLKTPLAILDAYDRGIRVIGVPPYQSHDRVKVLRGGEYLIAKPDVSELTFYNDQSEMDHRITLKVGERDVTEDEIREFLSDHDREHHQKFRSRIPDIKPPFLDVWASDRHILLKTDEIGEEQEFVLLSRDGDPMGRFNLSTFDDIRWIEGDRIYSLHQHPEEGHSIRVYELNL